MGVRLAAAVAVVFLFQACGGSDFEDKGTGGSGTGGAAGSGASGASGGGGGTSGSGGNPSGGASGSGGAPTGGGGSGGSSGSGGSGGSGGSAGDASLDGSSDAGGDAGGDASDASGPPPISVVQASPIKTTLTDDVSKVSFTALPVAGRAIIVGVTCISDFQGDCIIDPGGVTDNQGNTYTRALQGESIKSSAQGARGYIFIAENIGAPSGTFEISVNPNGAVPPNLQGIAFGAIEVAGLAAPPSLDATGVSLVGGTSQISTTATTDLATKQPNELAVGLLYMRSTDTNMLITPENNWVQHHIHQNNNSGPPGHSLITQVQTGIGKVTHTWTHDAPTRGVAAIMATFKGASQN